MLLKHQNYYRISTKQFQTKAYKFRVSHHQQDQKNQRKNEAMIIDWITYLINNIPEIISYIVYGYVFLVFYYWISFKDNKDFNNLLIKSIAASYLLTSVYELFIAKYDIVFDNNYYKVISYFVISALLGFAIGKIISHRWFNLLLHKLHIGRTTNSNIWDDIIKPYTWIRVFMKDGSSYLGQYRYGEPFQREPIIVLATYQKLDKDTDVVIDNSQKMNELIMINTKDFEKIEIIYIPIQSKNCFQKFYNWLKKKILHI